MGGRQKCTICGKYGLKFQNFRSDCSQYFQSGAVTPAKNFNKPSVWHFSFKINQNSHWGQHNVSDLLFGSTSSILNPGGKIVIFWEDFPAVESCEGPALCAGPAGAPQARRAALINPAGKFL